MIVGVIIFVAIVLLLLVLAAMWRARSQTQPRIASFKSGDFCYPCASPVDAQFGSVLYIAGKANLPRAARRFFLQNTSDQVMTVRSFTFGGYNRKFGGQVTEMISDKLMQQYGYSNVVQPGQVFSLDKANDEHVMYKGWYNAPLFIAYCFGEEKANSDYTILGWAPMRLQDEVTKYKYFYDAALKKDLLSKTPKGESRDSLQKALDVTETFTLARNASIHWHTGKTAGGARPLPTISNDTASQCYYVTSVNTFDSVNVHVPLCHISVNFGNITDYLSDPENRAQCLRDIAIVASSKVMDSSADLPNFMQEPDELAPWVVTSIATSLYLYVELGGIVVNVVGEIINVGLPGVGTAVIVAYDLTKLAITTVAGSGVLANVPGIGYQLNQIGMEYANGNTITRIADPFLSVMDAATSAGASSIIEGSKVPLSVAVKEAFKAGMKEAISQVASQGVAELVNRVPQLKGMGATVLQLVVSVGINKGFNILSPEGVTDALKDSAAAGMEIKGDVKQVIDDILNGQIKGAAAELALVINDNAAKLAEAGVKSSAEAAIKFIGQQLAVAESQLGLATSKGKGKEDWTPGKSGQPKYALERRLWVNSELKKHKFSTNARCSGDWKITYYDK